MAGDLQVFVVRSDGIGSAAFYNQGVTVRCSGVGRRPTRDALGDLSPFIAG